MIIDLTHNKIVADTMTERFAESVSERLLPLLREKYSETEIVGIQMYEDYIADEFSYRGRWYYPLTVVCAGEVYTEWISWELDKKSFKGGNPYAYVGEELLDFSVTVNIPEGFEDKLLGRARFCEGGLVNVRVETTASDITLLSGKYSQTFIDEMARQLTRAIESASSVEGLADSSIELSIVFSAGTYMEHTCENVTYRRLLLTDKAGAPRDFWIKWTRLDGAVGYSVSANVDSENILFELGEDVSQKIREKEYRFLVREGMDKYHNAMSRKNVTEWRDVIKRAIRRGELTKVEGDVELTDGAREVQRKLADLLGATAEIRENGAPTDDEKDSERDLVVKAALETLRDTEDDTDENVVEDAEITVEIELEADEESDVTEQTDAPETTDGEDADAAEDGGDSSEISFFEEEEDEEEELDELEALYAEEESLEISEGAVAADDDEAAELDEITRQALEALQHAKNQNNEGSDEAVEFEIDDSEEENEQLQIPALIVPDDPTGEEFTESDTEADGDSVDNSDEDSEEDSDEETDAEPDDVDGEAEEFTDEEDVLDEQALADVRALEPDEDDVTDDSIDVEANADETATPDSDAAGEINEDKIREEIASKLRLEYETLARQRAEEEAAKLRREQEALRLENEKIIAEAKREQERLRVEYERLREQTKKQDAIREAREAVRRAEEDKLRAQIEMQLRQEARERERLAEAARMAIEEQRRLEEEKARVERERAEEERRREEARLRAEENAREEAIREAEAARIRREAEVARAAAEAAMKEANDPQYKYTSKFVKLMFRRSVDPNITTRIHEIIKATIEYYAKEKIYLKIRATIPDSQTVCLEFVQIPLEEMQLLTNIVKILGNSGLGIVKASID